MYVDYQALAEEAIRLNNVFNNLNKILQSLESSCKNIYSNANWSANTRDYYYEKCQDLFQNFDVIANQFLNIRQYLDNVIDNYATADNSLNNAFASFGGF